MVTFITVPEPQKIPDSIEMAKIVLRVWLTYPFTRILMFTQQSECDPLNKAVPSFWMRLAPTVWASAGICQAVMKVVL
jgi:hypothetical protein